MDNSPDFLTHYEMKLSVLYSMVLYCNQTELHSWTKVLGHFCISGAFSNSHRPNLSPHPTKQCWTRASKIFSESKLCMGLKGGRGGGGRNARKFRKGSTVSWGNPEWQKNMNIASLSQGLLSMIVQVWFQDNCFFEWFLQCALSAVLFLTKMGGRLHMSSFSTASLCFLHLLQYLKKKKVNKIHINLLLCNFYLPNFTHPPQ